jgi:hypothetical protein
MENHSDTAHWSVLIKDFLAKKHATTMGHPQYYPDLAAADFYLFPRMKSSLKGRDFCDATDIVKNETEELKRFLQNDFKECFHHLYSRCKKCIVAQGH